MAIGGSRRLWSGAGVSAVVAVVATLAAGPAGAAHSAASSCPAWVTAKPLPATKAKVSVRSIGRIDVGPTRALIGGSVGARGGWLLVEYGRGRGYGSCSSWAKGIAAGKVAELRLQRLQPSATYHFRLVAKTSAGPAFGSDRTFRTLAGGRIPEGVRIGSIAVGGMTRTEASAQLAQLLAAPLRLTYSGAYWHVARSTVGARIDSRDALTAALTASPDQTLAAPPVTVDKQRLGRFLATLGKRWSHASRQSSVALVGHRAVVKPAKSGIVVDTARMSLVIAKALRTDDRGLLSLAVKKEAPSSATPVKAVVIRLGSQTLTAYLNGKPVLTTPITSGRPALPTPVGSYYIHFRASPYTFISPWPPGSPYYYPPAPVTWAMYFYDNDFLHDDPAEPSSSFGAGSEYGPYASHGCVHVPHDSMAFLYDWLPIGAPVIVAQD